MSAWKWFKFDYRRHRRYTNPVNAAWQAILDAIRPLPF
jgi:hypothetical protein